jgi:hypothetical protein
MISIPVLAENKDFCISAGGNMSFLMDESGFGYHAGFEKTWFDFIFMGIEYENSNVDISFITITEDGDIRDVKQTVSTQWINGLAGLKLSRNFTVGGSYGYLINTAIDNSSIEGSNRIAAFAELKFGILAARYIYCLNGILGSHPIHNASIALTLPLL